MQRTWEVSGCFDFPIREVFRFPRRGRSGLKSFVLEGAAFATVAGTRALGGDGIPALGLARGRIGVRRQNPALSPLSPIRSIPIDLSGAPSDQRARRMRLWFRECAFNVALSVWAVRGAFRQRSREAEDWPLGSQ